MHPRGTILWSAMRTCRVTRKRLHDRPLQDDRLPQKSKCWSHLLAIVHRHVNSRTTLVLAKKSLTFHVGTRRMAHLQWRFGRAALLTNADPLHLFPLRMCTLSFIPHDNGYVVGMNRDEQHTRPHALPPSPHGDAIYPHEPVTGGTWLAINSSGLTLALL